MCPYCEASVKNSKALRTKIARTKYNEIRRRWRYCKACGVQYTTYEFAVRESDDIKKISENIKEMTKTYPPIIKPYKWKATLF
jgi:transcriptional regulator NrdR family protein